MQKVNCRTCGKLLAKAIYTTLEVKCPRCKTLNHLSVTNAPTDGHEPLVKERNNDATKTPAVRG